MLTSQPDLVPNVRDGVTCERRVNEFASRIEAGDVRGLIKRRININEGTNALILVDGMPRGIAPPGPVDLSWLAPEIGLFDWFTRRRKVTAIIVDTSDTQVSFSIDGVVTADDHRVTVEVDLRFRIPHSVGRVNVEAGRAPLGDFYRNVMKDLRQFTMEDWQRYLMPEMDSAVRDFCSIRSVAEIRVAGVAGLKALAMHALDYMKRTCASAGIELSDVRGLRVEDPADADDQDLRNAMQGMRMLEQLKAMKRRIEADSSPSQAKE